MLLDDLLEREGFSEECDDCCYYSEHTENHPYGMGSASETLGECDCPKDTNCPRLADLV
jgi:hypothetical protein